MNFSEIQPKTVSQKAPPRQENYKRFQVLGFSQDFSINRDQERRTAQSPDLESLPRSLQIIKANSYYTLHTQDEVKI